MSGRHTTTSPGRAARRAASSASRATRSSPGRARGGPGASKPPSRCTRRDDGRPGPLALRCTGATAGPPQRWARERARRTSMSALVSRRQAVACSGAVLVAHVGLAHEVVGTVVYPYGPGVFGGPVGWHAAGFSVVASGLLMAIGVPGFIRVPVVLLATGPSAAT